MASVAGSSGGKPNSSERRLLAQLAPGQTQVADEVLDHRHTSGVAALLLALRDPAQGAQRSDPRLLRGHAAGHIGGALFLQVKAQLFVQLAIDRTPRPQ